MIRQRSPTTRENAMRWPSGDHDGIRSRCPATGAVRMRGVVADAVCSTSVAPSAPARL
jgi:hypothetical protein